MKKIIPLLLGLITLAGTPGQAQPSERPMPLLRWTNGTQAGTPGQAQQSERPAAPAAPAKRELTKFNLSFPGGTPKDLVAAIQQAMGRPVNVIIPDDLAQWRLPPLKMNGVDVPQLFRALEQAGKFRETVATGIGSNLTIQSQYGFSTSDNNPATQTDDTVWFFYLNGATRMPKVSRFYLLTPYLAAGLTVDDITTAIQTGWKMRGEATPPALSFHKETNLLIAVGEYGGLEAIDGVLKALDAMKAQPAAAKAAAAPKTKP